MKVEKGLVVDSIEPIESTKEGTKFRVTFKKKERQTKVTEFVR